MAATDLLVEVGDPGSATTLDSNYTINDSTVTVVSTTNWPATGKAVIFAIDEAEVINGEESQIAGTYNEFEGTVASATSISNVNWQRGSGDRNYTAGSLTRVYIPVSAERENRIVEWGEAEHNKADGTHTDITADSVTSTGTVQGATVVATGDIQHRSVSLEAIRANIIFDHVASGCVWSGDSYGSTRNASMTAGVIYINGKRVAVSSVTARSFTASKDTYIDVGDDGVVDYTEVTNNASSPALSANHIRIGIIVTGASSIANVGSINQGQPEKVLPIASSIPYITTDSLGNLICPRDAQRRTLAYTEKIAGQSTTSTSDTDVTGMSLTFIAPANCTSVYLRAEASPSNNTASSSVIIGITDSSNVVQVDRSTIASASSANEVHTVSLARKITVTPGTTYTMKLRFRVSAGTGVINQGDVSTRPTILQVDRG